MSNRVYYKAQFGSSSFFVLVGVCAFFAWTQYEFYQSALFSSDLIRNFGTYSGLMKVPWWIATFYGSELGGTIGGIMRWLASFIALYCALVYWRRGEASFVQITRKIGAALLLEGVYFLFLIPSVILGFVFPFTAGKVWYFDVTPVPGVFFVAEIACLMMVLTFLQYCLSCVRKSFGMRQKLKLRNGFTSQLLLTYL
jgi:hypothetical protein